MSFSSHVAAQKKDGNRHGHHPPGSGRGGVHRECDRPNPQVSFSGLLVLLLLFFFCLQACPKVTGLGRLRIGGQGQWNVPKSTSSLPPFDERRTLAAEPLPVHFVNKPSGALESRVSSPGGTGRLPSLHRPHETGPVTRSAELRIQQSTRDEIGWDLFLRLTQQSDYGSQRHLLGL